MQLIGQTLPQASCLTVPASSFQTEPMDEAANICRLTDAVHCALRHVCPEFHDIQGEPVLPSVGLHDSSQEGLQEHT